MSASAGSWVRHGVFAPLALALGLAGFAAGWALAPELPPRHRFAVTSVPTPGPDSAHETLPGSAPAALHRSTPPIPDLDAEIERLGAQSPRYPEPIREQYEEAPDLERFLRGVLASARAGDAASQYHVYMLLEECRAYLELGATRKAAMHPQAAERKSAWSHDEAALADRDHRRCAAFAEADLAPLVAGMGDDVPNGVSEYASVWFERAVHGAYPPALANLALRPYGFDAAERLALLQSAVAGGDPDALWRVFGQASTQGQAADARAVAWLIAACRAGLDCREGATWYRGWRCGFEGSGVCEPGISAVANYWYALPAADRAAAYRLASAIEDHLAHGRLDHLPWPALPAGRG